MSKYDNYNPNISNIDDFDAEGYSEPSKKREQQRRSAESKSVKEGKAKRSNKPNGRKNSNDSDYSVSKFIGDVISFFKSPTLRVIVGCFLLVLGAYLTISFISYFKDCITDQSDILHAKVGTAKEIANNGGEGGARISELLINQGFGLASFVIIFWLIALGIKMLGVKIRFNVINFTIKCLVALIAASLLIGIVTISINSPVNWGGFHGRYVIEKVHQFTGWAGAWLLAIFMLAVFCILCLRDIYNGIMRWYRKKQDEKRARIEEYEAERERERRIRELERKEREEAAMVIPENIEESDESEESEENQDENKDVVEFEQDTTYQIPDEDDINEVETSEENKSEEKVSSADKKEEEKLVVNVNGISEYAKGKYPEAEGIPGKKPYKFPPYDILRAETRQIIVDEEEQLANEEKIRSTLQSFGIEIKSIEATVGPTVTLYEIMLETGVKIARVRNLSDEIAMTLAATASVRIIAPIPGKNTVGIEVGNRNPVTVSMRTIIKSKAYAENKYQLPLALGSTIQNEVYVADLAEMPHLLVAGATGQGKSVGLNAIVASLLYAKSPDELKFVMVDPKMVEFSFYEKIKSQYLAQLPDMESPIITEPDKVVPTLNSLCIEMDERYLLLKAAGCRKVTEYNAKICNSELDPNEGHRYLPYIVVLVDEFSDLMITAGKEVEKPIVRLAQKARAVGMHVIIATQRPSADVITGVIKANFPARIAFRVTNGIDSKTILNSTSAHQLIGRGDMLVSHRSELVRVQCAFIDTPEVEKICDYIAKQPYPRGVYMLPEPPMTGDGDAKSISSSERDSLFEEAARMVIATNTASTSSIQRRYNIGYNRAGRIMDQLEAMGIVGPSMNGKPRNVLVDEVTLERILSENL